MEEPHNSYGISRARPPGPRARPGVRTVDCHAHAWVTAAASFVQPHIGELNTSLLRAVEPQTQAINRRQGQDRQPQLTDLATRLAAMDEMGLDMQVVLPSPSQAYYELPEALCTEAARINNDGIAALVAGAPTRLIPFGTVPLPYPGQAVTELRRCVEQLGFKGVQILTNVLGQEVSAPAFAPFWAEAERLGAAVLMHPLGFTPPDRLTRFYLNNVIGQPLDTTVALHYLIFDGVLARHPALKLIAVHGGGYLGGYHGRIDHAWGARSDVRAGLPQPPSTYLRQVYVDGVVFTPEQLEAVVRVFGPDHVMMGTDYPYDMAEYDPLAHLASATALDEETVAKIAGGNALRLFGL